MALDIVRARKGTDNVVALALLRSRHNFTREDFADLSKTRFLELDGGNLTGDFENLFPELRWLCWHHCPSKLQANNFILKSLVILKLSGNIIIDEWSGWVQIMVGSKLKVLKLKVVKINSCAIRFQLENNIGRFTSYLSAQRPESYAEIMSKGELGSSWRLSEYPIDLLIDCGIIETVYDVDLQCMPSFIKQISVSTIFNAPKTSLPASKILAIPFGGGSYKCPAQSEKF
ncbi:hypothetical protein NL676_033333 [Syzygium grande]|nr:hypothetical protein NL676_033333 [Syzygium grande]